MIRRGQRPERYLLVSNDVVRDVRLSRRARGLLVELLSRPDNWQINVAGLLEGGPEGRDAIRAALRELEEVGYARWETKQEPGSGKLAGRDLVVYDETPSQTVELENPSVGKTERREIRHKEVPIFKEVPIGKESPKASDDEDMDLLGDPVAAVAPKKRPMQVAFEEWWDAYPKHEARGAAERYYRAARRIATRAALLVGAQEYAAHVKDTDPKFVARPDNWLRDKRWGDEYPDEPADDYRSSEW